MYPESNVIQLESPQDTRDREGALYRQFDSDQIDEFWDEY